ncbi:MAG: diaminopimelate epimerase [Gammaproteobacteria bacterium]
MKFAKYHALGNDYLVLNPADVDVELTRARIRVLCHRQFGVGADGILIGPIETTACDFALRIFNPDGSEAEKSGNGLRIFARYLWDRRLVRSRPFTVLTGGGKAGAYVQQDGKRVCVEMGRVSFDSADIPVSGPRRDVLNETLVTGGETLSFCAATIGNPHCIILRDEVSRAETERLGPLIEHDARFANRTNVQFMNVLDRGRIQLEIWERGAGRTLASGSSASAAAAVAHKLGLCDADIEVRMPGGLLDIAISDEFEVTMTGPVTRVCDGTVATEMIDQRIAE